MCLVALVILYAIFALRLNRLPGILLTKIRSTGLPAGQG
jgi:hypothetical protein